MVASGQFFDGESSRAQEVTVQIVNEDLEIRTAAGLALAHWPQALIRDENVPPVQDGVFLSLSDTSLARLRITDPLFVQKLIVRCPRLSKRRKAEVRHWAKPAAATAAVVGLVTAVILFGVPWISIPVAKLIPATALRDIGQGVEDEIIRRAAPKGQEAAQVCQSKVAQAALDRVLGRFLSVSPLVDNPDIQLSVRVIKSKVANALALPGGRILVFSGLIDRADDVNGLVGVLAHEFAHVEAQHPARLLVTNVGMAAILSLVFGDVSGGTMMAAAGQMALGASYSRDFERAADMRSIELMQQLSYNLKPLIPLLEKIQKAGPKSGLWTFMNTHPGIESRIEMLKVAGNTGTTAPVGAEEWNEIKTMCEASI